MIQTTVEALVIAQQYYVERLEKEIAQLRKRIKTQSVLQSCLRHGDIEPLTCESCLTDPRIVGENATEQLLCEQCWLHLLCLPQQCWACGCLMKHDSP